MHSSIDEGLSPAARACVVAFLSGRSVAYPGLADSPWATCCRSLRGFASYRYFVVVSSHVNGFNSNRVDNAESRIDDSNSIVTCRNPVLMKRDYYSSTIERFLDASPEEIIGSLTINSGFAVEPTQRDAWREEITILKTALSNKLPQMTSTTVRNFIGY